MIRLPLNKVGEMHKRAKFIAQKLQSDEREPTAEEMAEVLGISVEQVIALNAVNGRHILLTTRQSTLMMAKQQCSTKFRTATAKQQTAF
jgi:DNA-directed RNA polymerase sigma subunit (sigma70/sigma32)